MKIEYDHQVDALYIRIKEEFVHRTLELDEGVNLDFDENNRLIGIEILDAKMRYSPQDLFNFSTEQLVVSGEDLIS
ncbi:DUF2283 domain-containing protein [bacterium]|nr:DUF2283 domain-containing protein [FCB group bacterium]MBL7190283.1 DUF2283 domain-containing protein [bacterium]